MSAVYLETGEQVNSSLLDAVPGARAAYDFVRAQVSAFNLIGLQQIPGYQNLLRAVGPRVRASGDVQLVAQYDAAQQDVQSLAATWEGLDTKVKGVQMELGGLGLGQVPWGVLIAVGGSLIVVAGGMYLFFDSAEHRQDQVNTLVTGLVNRHLMTPAEAVRHLRSGSVGGELASIGQSLVLLAIVGAAIWFIPRRRA